MLLNLTENEFFFLRKAFCGLEYAENAFFGQGFAPDPTGGAHDAPPYSWSAGDETPLPDSTPLGALGASTLALEVGSAPVHIISGYATVY